MAASRYPLVLTDAERAMLEDTWPLDLITDNQRQPLEVFTPTAFAARVLLADHLEDVVVFRNGEKALGIAREDCLPDWVSDCLEHAKDPDGASVLKFLRRPSSTPKVNYSKPTSSLLLRKVSRRRPRCRGGRGPVLDLDRDPRATARR